MPSSELNVTNSYEKYANEYHKSISTYLYPKCPESIAEDSPVHVI